MTRPFIFIIGLIGLLVLLVPMTIGIDFVIENGNIEAYLWLCGIGVLLMICVVVLSSFPSKYEAQLKSRLENAKVILEGVLENDGSRGIFDAIELSKYHAAADTFLLQEDFLKQPKKSAIDVNRF